MSSEYLIIKAILAGLELKMTGTHLLNFVQRCTECSLDQFEKAYEEVIKAWTN